MTDAILQIVTVIAGLWRDNIDSLKVPEILKSALKTQAKDKEEGKVGDSEPENAKQTNKSEWDQQREEKRTMIK